MLITRAGEISRRVEAREFEIDESMICYWQNKTDVIAKLSKRQGTCWTSENTLKEWNISQRENSCALTTVMIWPKVNELVKQMNVADFVGGPSWCSRFMRQHRLSVSENHRGPEAVQWLFRTFTSLFCEERRSLESKEIVFNIVNVCVPSWLPRISLFTIFVLFSFPSCVFQVHFTILRLPIASFFN